MSEILSGLKALLPVDFENLVFDLAAEIGLRNAVWRSPGADGGRDIQGEVTTVDFSGHRETGTWYIECKRYGRAVDWPTVWEKLAFADSNGAAYLLMVSTAPLSPACLNEVAKWNDTRKLPRVRSWDGARLERLVLQYPAVLTKYGLPGATTSPSESFMTLATQCVKTIQAAYGHGAIDGEIPASLEAAASIAELLRLRMGEVAEGRRYLPTAFDPAEDGYPWLHSSVDLTAFDRYGLRALLSFVRHATGQEQIVAAAKDGAVFVHLVESGRVEGPALDFIVHLALWARAETAITGGGLILRPQVDHDRRPSS